MKGAITRLIVRVVVVAVVLWLLVYPLRPRLITLAQELASDWRVYVFIFIVSFIAYCITRRGRVYRAESTRLSTAERVPVDADLEQGR